MVNIMKNGIGEIPAYIRLYDKGSYIIGYSSYKGDLISNHIYKVSNKVPRSTYYNKIVLEVGEEFAEIGNDSSVILYVISDKESFDRQEKGLFPAYVKLLDSGAYISSYSSSNITDDDIKNGKIYRISSKLPISKDRVQSIVLDIDNDRFAEFASNHISKNIYVYSTKEEFDKQIIEQSIKFRITRSQLQEIHTIACSEWQSKLANLAFVWNNWN
jgi:GTP-sensing pleiotropic transcriptional regulator CodY